VSSRSSPKKRENNHILSRPSFSFTNPSISNPRRTRLSRLQPELGGGGVVFGERWPWALFIRASWGYDVKDTDTLLFF
jgi:hypothetical protein